MRLKIFMGNTLTVPLMLATVLLLTACQGIGILTSGTETTVDAIRTDICTRIWRGVTTSRNDVLTEQTALEIEQDTVARNAYCNERITQ